MAIVRFPDDAEIQEAFERYARAVGSVAYSWNRLHEKLGELFVRISRLNREAALTKWHSITNDKRQRRELEKSAKRLPALHPMSDVRRDILWVIEQADILSEDRNDAIHAPATLYVGHEKDRAEMGAMFFSGHPRAERLRGKQLLIEFQRCEEWSDALQLHAVAIGAAWDFPSSIPLTARPIRPAASL